MRTPIYFLPKLNIPASRLALIAAKVSKKEPAVLSYKMCQSSHTFHVLMLLSPPCSSVLVYPELLAQPGLRQPEVRAQVHQEQRLPQLLRVPRRRLRAHREVQVQQRLWGRRDMHHQRPGLRSAGVQGK